MKEENATTIKVSLLHVLQFIEDALYYIIGIFKLWVPKHFKHSCD